MREPPTPPDEARRLRALQDLDLLDTEEEERFNRVTRLAQRMFGTPIALVSLVDEERQWFKSRQGLDATETPRSISFCGHAVLGTDVFVVPDTREDPRFADNPLVMDEPRIRFYAGYPISAPDGSKIGTLCIIDRKPRNFDEADFQVLQDLGRTIEQEIVARGMATRDDLTKLSNRRGFMQIARNALEMCRRMKRPASLLYFDIDKFKQINDQYGHAAGDVALTDFARLLSVAFRESDVIARKGGDEFCVLLTGSTAGNCRAALARFEALLEAHNRASTAGYDLEYSFGLVEFDAEDHGSIEDLVGTADERMFAMKREQGRARE